jgi:hypothetical protein
MSTKMLVSLVILSLLFMGVAGAAPTDVAERLIVRDPSGKIPTETYAKLVDKAQLTFREISTYWGGAQGPGQSEKIVVEFDPSATRTPYSFFFFRTENGTRVRVVRVSGGGVQPHQLAHKLTSALFPHPDKLIRNMMGEASERQFGNPLSFPVCGAEIDEWVMALIQSGSYIPLSKIGTSHADWGMADINNAPVVKDRKKQHICYAEAGSFGQFLIDTFGRGKMKEFYRRTEANYRPWQEVFGFPLTELESQWLENVKRKTEGQQEIVAALTVYWGKNPTTACFEAQRQARPISLIKGSLSN